MKVVLSCKGFGLFGMVLFCGVRIHKVLFYKAFAGFYFLSGSVKIVFVYSDSKARVEEWI